MNPPTLAEQIEAIQRQIETLVDSYSEPNGQITEPGIVHDIECLKATLAVLRAEADPNARHVGAIEARQQ